MLNPSQVLLHTHEVHTLFTFSRAVEDSMSHKRGIQEVTYTVAWYVEFFEERERETKREKSKPKKGKRESFSKEVSHLELKWASLLSESTMNLALCTYAPTKDNVDYLLRLV